jgi:hypothetical protein
MRPPIAKLALLPSIALVMLIALESAPHAQEYLSHEAAYVPRHHAAPPLAYDAQGNPNYGFGPLRPLGPARDPLTAPLRSYRRDRSLPTAPHFRGCATHLASIFAWSHLLPSLA